MAQRSDKHSAARKEKTGWICELCESESNDFELFEQAGEIENCLERGQAAGVVPNTEDLVACADVERVRAHMEQVRASLATMGPAASKAAREMNKFKEAWEAMNMELKTYSDRTRRTTIIGDDNKGGSNFIENIQPLCGPCNSRKGTKITDYRQKAETDE